MSYKKIIVPVGAALAALISNGAEASTPPVKSPADSLELQGTARTGTESVNAVLQRLMYQIGENAHDMTLHKSSSGTLYAQHGSHRSHASHSSHSSHRSGY